MKKIIIAIDGYSSTGKSTVAKQLAKRLGYIYVDSGAMYRAVTLFAMQHDFINETHVNIGGLLLQLKNITIRFKFNDDLGFAEVYLNGKNVEKEIRTLEVSNCVSQISKIPGVRHQLVKQQQLLGKDKGIVMDGRDIGTVVFPNAELKIFMTASLETRAKRRYEELISKGEQVSYKDVLHNVQERDTIDSHREDSPLVKAKDAVEIDNSQLTLQEQFDNILQLSLKTLKNKA